MLEQDFPNLWNALLAYYGAVDGAYEELPEDGELTDELILENPGWVQGELADELQRLLSSPELPVAELRRAVNRNFSTSADARVWLQELLRRLRAASSNRGD